MSSWINKIHPRHVTETTTNNRQRKKISKAPEEKSGLLSEEQELD